MHEKIFNKFKLNNPVEMKSDIPESKVIFYDLARAHLEYQTRQQNIDWQKKNLGRKNWESTATYIINTKNVATDGNEITRYVDLLKIVVNKGLFEDVAKIIDEDCMDLIPYVVEHDIYEAWLNAKRGIGSTFSVKKQHLLARRREFYLAAKDGRGDKLLRFHMTINPSMEAEYKSALNYAQNRLERTDSVSK